MNEFGEYLRELRGDRSLREMERITGLSHTYLSTLEKGVDPRSGKERKPTPETLKKISETLNVPYEELMKKAGYIKSLGKRVKELREEKGWTLEEFSKKSGLSFEFLSLLESDKIQKVTSEIMRKLAKGFGISIAELFEENETIAYRAMELPGLSYLSITEMSEEERKDFGRFFAENRKYLNYSLEKISQKTLIPIEDLKLLEKGKLKRNLTELESINLVHSFELFDIQISPNRLEDFEIGNLILFNQKVNFKGKPLTLEARKELYEAITKVMSKYSK